MIIVDRLWRWRIKISRPSIKSKVVDIDKYDTIVIGFPVWWYTAPHIVNTFIEENNLENKNIYIFVTSGGSSFDGIFNNLKNTYSNLNFIRGIRFTSSLKDEEIRSFIDK